MMKYIPLCKLFIKQCKKDTTQHLKTFGKEEIELEKIIHFNELESVNKGGTNTRSPSKKLEVAAFFLKKKLHRSKNKAQISFAILHKSEFQVQKQLIKSW